MPIVQSTLQQNPPELDGRRYVIERHTDHLSREHIVIYWCEAGADPYLQLNNRAVVLGELIDHKLLIEASTSSVFDEYGAEIKEALRWLIENIRKYPGVSYATAAAVWDAEMADSLFSFDRLAVWVQSKVGELTWDQAKTFMINHYFGFVDYGA